MARKKKEETPAPTTEGAEGTTDTSDNDGGDDSGDDDKPKDGSVADQVKRNFSRRRQDSLPGPGFARPAIPELDEAALEFVTHRDERMSAGEREKAAKKKLRGLVDKYRDQLTNSVTGKVVYRFDAADGATQEVLLEPSEVKLTVRKVDPDSSPGSSGNGDD